MRQTVIVNVQTVVEGAREKLLSVDVQSTTASCVSTTVSAYFVSPSACTPREATPATLAMAPFMAGVIIGGEPLTVGAKE